MVNYDGFLLSHAMTPFYAQGKMELLPVEKYMEGQGRYSHLMKSPEKEANLAAIQEEIKRDLKFMAGRAKL